MTSTAAHSKRENKVKLAQGAAYRRVVQSRTSRLTRATARLKLLRRDMAEIKLKIKGNKDEKQVEKLRSRLEGLKFRVADHADRCGAIKPD